MNKTEFRKLIREEIKNVVKEQRLYEAAEYFPAKMIKHLQRAILAALKDGTIRIVGADTKDFPGYAEDIAVELIKGKSLTDIITATTAATSGASNKYSNAASLLYKNVDEILKHYMVDDEYEYEQYKRDIKKIQSQEDITKWYKTMSKELKVAYGSDSDPIKDITKESSAIAKKAGVSLK